MSDYFQTEANNALLNTLVVAPISDFTPTYEAV
jgi:hypothetical protein